ncbi:MAG: hypothetical protein QM767_30095 [Anaeromyxobacter sp.]
MGALAALLAAALAAAPAGDAAAGERLYRDGRLAGGAPVQAVVLDGLPISGAQVSCAACHGRSGMGADEGGVVTPSITAATLAAPRGGERPRPAYDRAALARAIREGVDAAGRPLDPLMPRFRLEGRELEALLDHLGGLSARPSPGAGEALHLATVIAPDAPPEVRDATLAVLRAYVAAHNAAARVERLHHRRVQRPTLGDEEPASDWVLHEWTLRGAPSSWGAQLAAQQRAQPAFAVVSGAGGARWEPVDRFCEAQRLPCLWPNLVTPPEAEGFYARYFSRGLRLEADTVAADLARRGGGQRVLQVLRRGGPGAAGAAALSAALRRQGVPAEALALGPAEAVDAGRLEAAARRSGATAVMLWLRREELALLAGAPQRLDRVYASSALLDGDLSAAAALPARRVAVAHAWALPEDAAAREAASEGWFRAAGLGPAGGAARRARDQSFAAMRLLGQALMHLEESGAFQRDFLLEVLDHGAGPWDASAQHPRLTFGPGQRYLSTGCYLVPVGEEAGAPAWIVP